MSNTNTSIEFDVVPCTNAVPESQATDCKECAPKKYGATTRVFAFFVLAVCVAVFFLPVQVLKGVVPNEMTLFTALTDLFAGNATSSLFDVLPVYTKVTKITGLFVGVTFYAFLASLVFGVIFALGALISGKACALRTATFFLASGFGAYAVCGYALPLIKETAIGFDWVILGATGASALLYLVLGFARNGKKALVSLIQLVFTFVFSTAIILLMSSYIAEIKAVVEGFGTTFALVSKILVAVIWVDLVFGIIRLQTKKGLGLDMFRYILQLVVGVLLVYVAFTAKVEDGTPLLYAGVATGVSFVQILVCIAQIKSGKVKEEVEIVEEPAPEPVPEYTVEEYAEAMPYDGGPVEGVEIAQEVNPTFEENPIEPVQVNTAGYDFYNSKSFDPFIAILSNEERNQFTELFILKYKGVMPEIPDYQVGGDNKEFFRKLFIYLGQYRDRIPDGLLAKIYQFAIRNA